MEIDVDIFLNSMKFIIRFNPIKTTKDDKKDNKDAKKDNNNDNNKDNTDYMYNTDDNKDDNKRQISKSTCNFSL